jgi:hypothetical protein
MNGTLSFIVHQPTTTGQEMQERTNSLGQNFDAVQWCHLTTLGVRKIRGGTGEAVPRDESYCKNLLPKGVCLWEGIPWLWCTVTTSV